VEILKMSTPPTKMVKELIRAEKAYARALGDQTTPEAYFGEVGYLYSAFDADGVPMTTADGKELDEASRGRLRRKFEAHVCRHERMLTASARYGGVEAYLAVLKEKMVAAQTAYRTWLKQQQQE